MQLNLLKKHLEKISLELNHTINLLLKEKQKSDTMILKCLEDLEHILHIGKNRQFIIYVKTFLQPFA